MPKSDQRRETNESEIISEREVRFAIRYLDPDSDRRGSDIAETIAVLAIVCILCVVTVLIHFHGL